MITKISEANLPTKYCDFRIVVFTDDEGKEHAALIRGELKEPVLVRLHSECLTGDSLGSLKCDCGQQLEKSLNLISQEGGVLLYLKQEGRGIGLGNKIKAYSLQDKGRDTVQANEELGFDADARDYAVAAEILKEIGVKKVKVLTNNPKKIEALEKHGIEVVDRIPLITAGSEQAKEYLKTKKEKMGHLFESHQ